MLPELHISSPAHCYTAAQLAVALRISKQAVTKSLAGVPANEEIYNRGNKTFAWTVDALPVSITQKLTEFGRQNGLNIASYLDAGLKTWQPETPISEISDSCLNDARRLRDALLPALDRIGKPMFDLAELVRLGLADYERAFGHSVSEGHWRRLMDRTLLRDAGAKNFTRLEIYLPVKPARKTMPGPDARRFKDDIFFTDYISTFSDPANPTHHDVAALLGYIFEACGAKTLTIGEWKILRRILAKRLYALLPCLAASQRALRVQIDRKYQRWLAAGTNTSAMLDGRIEKRGVPVTKPFPQADIDIIMAAAAVNHGGKVAAAVRDLAEKGERSGLSAETLEIISRYRKSKSSVNRRLLKRVVPDVKMVMPFFLGKRAKDDEMAHVERDYSKLSVLQVVNADDVTAPIYFYVPDGNGWWNLTRGQVLIFIDVRSLKVIAWSLQPQRNYNSFVIRTLMNRVCAECGIPNVWHFEKGIWKRSHLVKGTAPAGWSVAGDEGEIKNGWEKIGSKFLHSHRARSKPVERVIGMLQDRMHGVRGYCGRDERVDLPEQTKRAMDDVEYRRVKHPGELFLSFDEWHEKLAGITVVQNLAQAAKDAAKAHSSTLPIIQRALNDMKHSIEQLQGQMRNTPYNSR
jgi:hypothetical protein